MPWETPRHPVAAVLEIALLTEGGKQHEPDKEPGDALAGNLADRDRPVASGQHSRSSHWSYTGSACYRCRRFDPGGSVSCLVLGKARKLRTLLETIPLGHIQGRREIST